MNFIAKQQTKWHLRRGQKKLKKAKRKYGKKFEGLIDAANDQFEAALESDPTNHQALKQWGQALTLAGQRTVGDDRRRTRLYKEAGKKYAAALVIQPEDPEIQYMWGLTLTKLAACDEITNPENVYQDVYKKLGGALKEKENYSQALHAWGLALYQQAHSKEDEARERLFAAACDKFEEALDKDGGNAQAFIDWGVVCMEQARGAEEKQQAELYHTAKLKFLAAEKFDKNGVCYNLACLYSLLGDAEKTEAKLKQGLKAGRLPRIHHIEGDPDLANVRFDPWFSKFIEKAKKRIA